VRYAPVLHLQKGLKPTVVVEAVLEGLRAATRETGILAGVLVCGIRNMSPDTSLRLAELSVAYKNRGVLDSISPARSTETGQGPPGSVPAHPQHNINCTVHAGEAYGLLPSRSAALLRRAPHRARREAARGRRPAQLRQRPPHPIECCPSSNVQTARWRTWRPPFKFYLDFGIRVTINTDNRLITTPP